MTAEEYLTRLRRYGIRPSLERIRAALESFGRPDRLYSIVLITGTNGKGTCAKTMAEILSAHGVRTGLYLSPHLRTYTERYEMNGRRMARAELERAVSDQRTLLAERRIRLTEFEFLTLLAYRWFAFRRASWAVVEAGMGGRWDATNAADPEISIITGVGLDHVEFLGATCARIAGDKARIARKARALLVGPVDPAIRRVIRQTAYRIGARPEFFGPHPDPLPLRVRRGCGALPASIFGSDVGLAVQASRRILLSRFSPSAARRGVRRVRLPGRFQRARISGRPAVLDVAHNDSAFKALFRHLRDRFPKRPFEILIGMQRQKRGEAAILDFIGSCDRVRLIRLNHRRNKPAAMWKPFIRAATSRGVRVTEPAPMRRALPAAVRSTPAGAIMIVTGSFHTVREALEERE